VGYPLLAFGIPDLDAPTDAGEAEPAAIARAGEGMHASERTERLAGAGKQHGAHMLGRRAARRLLQALSPGGKSSASGSAASSEGTSAWPRSAATMIGSGSAWTPGNSLSPG
jgi:hypothetical protein